MNGGSAGGESDRDSDRLSAEARAVVDGRLRWLLTREDLTRGELARRSGLAKTTVVDVMSGKTKDLSLSVLIRLVHGFGLRSIDELIAPLGTMQLCRIEFGGDVIA